MLLNGEEHQVRTHIVGCAVVGEGVEVCYVRFRCGGAGGRRDGSVRVVGHGGPGGLRTTTSTVVPQH